VHTVTASTTSGVWTSLTDNTSSWTKVNDSFGSNIIPKPDLADWTNSLVTRTQSEIGRDGIHNQAWLLSESSGSTGLLYEITSISLTGSITYEYSMFIRKDSDVSREPFAYIKIASGSYAHSDKVLLNTSDGTYTETTTEGNGVVYVQDDENWWKLAIQVTPDVTGTWSLFYQIAPAGGVSGALSNAATGSIIVDDVQLKALPPSPTAWNRLGTGE